jgi:hypothetical protein
VHHLFDASLEVIKYLNKPSDKKISSLSTLVSSHDSRLGALEAQFSIYRAQQDLSFAIQQEINDWHENDANQNFFVVSGLPNPPSKMTGGNAFYCTFPSILIVVRVVL